MPRLTTLAGDVVSQSDDTSLQACRCEGMLDRAAGMPRSANPYLSAAARPEATGQSKLDWLARYGAWRQGWAREDDLLGDTLWLTLRSFPSP